MTILGIDISKWDGNWNASKAKQAGATFVFIKASQATFTDPQFQSNWQKAKDAGLLRGAYHYLDYTKTGTEQANYFANLLKDDPGELPPVIDYELRRTDNNPALALGFLRECLDQLMKRNDLFSDAVIKRPMIYTGPGFWTEYGDQTKSDYWIQFPLWNAHWTTSNTPQIPAPWTTWEFWQFSSKGPGEAFGSESLTMDMNRFNGTLSELLEFAGVKVPLSNLNELYNAMDEKVTKLESVVALLNQVGDNSSGLTGRIAVLESSVTNLNGTLTSLGSTFSQRLSEMEQKLAGMNSGINPPPVSYTPPTEPVTTPVETPLEPPATITPPTNSITYATCTTSALNVRSGPGASYPMVAGLKYGQQVKVLARQDGWAQLESPAGWSSEAYLSFGISTPPVSNEIPPAVSLPETYGICNTSGLNVRSGPGTTYPITGGLTYGQRVRILNHKNGWAQVETPAGWCNESYLSFA
jgi:lysozyme